MQIDRLELIVTYRCNSNCSHCLIQPQQHRGETMSPVMGREIIEHLGKIYRPFSVMTFGGEPMLALDTVIAIHDMASKIGIPQRQVLTNGNWLFTRTTIDRGKPLNEKEQTLFDTLAKKLFNAGVTSVLLSADVFHEEYLDLTQVLAAAKAVQSVGIPEIAVSPRWIESPSAENPLDRRTREILQLFRDQHIPIDAGENVQPRGNAVINHSRYFSPITLAGRESCTDVSNAPCLNNIRGVCISPTGDAIVCNNIIIGDGTPDSLLNLLQNYSPQNYPEIRMLQKSGLKGLIDLVKAQGLIPEEGPFYSICDACFRLRRQLHFARTCNA